MQPEPVEATANRRREVGDNENPTLACITPQPDNYISSKQFSKKYGLELRIIAPACRAGALLSDKRDVVDGSHYNRIVKRWFVLDIPPDDHPKWPAYKKKRLVKFKPTSNYLKKLLDDGVLLERFNEARVKTEQSDFNSVELAKMLQINRQTLYTWVEVGVKGYGQLPKIVFPEDKLDKYGRVDSYFRQEDIIRFLKGELKDPKKTFKTISDMVTQTDIDRIAEKHGYFAPGISVKKYPMSYEGFVRWAEDSVCRYDKEKQKWIPFRAIEMQRECYKNIWELRPDGRLKHRFIRLCRPRGDFKSFDAILIALFRFFNMEREKILFAANSKDQSEYSLYDEAKDIVLNSPELMKTPGLEVREEEIRLMTGKREKFNRLMSIASKQGSLSNATCIVFSEIHKLTDQSFIVELEGSIRQVVNAMSIIESTVSRVGTYYHRQYELSLKGTSTVLYFQYYCDKHYNPNMTQEELDHYRESFFPEEYDMYFRNRWADAGSGLFSTVQIQTMRYIGADGQILTDETVPNIIREMIDVKQKIAQLEGSTDTSGLHEKMHSIQKRLYPVDTLYKIPATRKDLDMLEKLFGLDYMVGIGIDRAEQMRTRSDRTSVVTTAKWHLPGSLDWIAFVLDIYMPATPNMNLIIDRILRNTSEFGFISKIDIEKSQGLDIYNWCKDNDYDAELVSASYEHQHQIFLETYNRARIGLLKCPRVPIYSDEKSDIHYEMPPESIPDILEEELTFFEHVPKVEGKKAGYFGSSFKRKSGRTKLGEAKDDVIYGLGHSIWAANTGELTASMAQVTFSGAQMNRDVIGAYK